MKNLMKITLWVMSAALFFVSCQKKNNSEEQIVLTPADIAGVYTGTFPGADNEGIDVVLTLRDDNVLYLHESYRGKEKGIFDFVGNYEMDGNHLKLMMGGDAPYIYLYQDAKLIRLNDDGTERQGEGARFYDLTRTSTEVKMLPDEKIYVNTDKEELKIQNMHTVYSEDYLSVKMTNEKEPLMFLYKEEVDGKKVYGNDQYEIVLDHDDSKLTLKNIEAKKSAEYDLVKADADK